METVVLDTVMTVPGNPGPPKHKRPDKRQVRDGDIVIGTVERDRESGGVYAVLEATGEQDWFKNGDDAEYWLREQRKEMQHQDALEARFALRHQWDYVD